jgi:hypothetical protein
VEHRDRRKQEPVGDRDQRVVEIGVGDRADGDDEQLRDAGGGAPDRGLARVDYFADGFF